MTSSILPTHPDHLLQAIEQACHQRYAIQRTLGKQSGRRTYLAKVCQTGQPVIIKCLLFGHDFQWQTLKLFEREAETLRSLNHPAIPRYIDFFDVDTQLGQGFALVQSYIDAPSLQNMATAGHRFSESHLKYIAQSLLTTLHHLHTTQPSIIHRDIKPSNVLLATGKNEKLGKVYLVDFGAVKTTPTQGTMTIVGTYGYMPPEQFGGQATPASDLYSLGATLIYLATGKHPSELLQDNLQLKFEHETSLSIPFVQWLKQLTAVELSRRTPTAAQALSQLTLPKQLDSPSGLQPHQNTQHANNNSDLALSHGAFRQIASQHKQQEFQLYITGQAFEIAFPMKHLKDRPATSTGSKSLFNYGWRLNGYKGLQAVIYFLIWIGFIFFLSGINFILLIELLKALFMGKLLLFLALAVLGAITIWLIVTAPKLWQTSIQISLGPQKKQASLKLFFNEDGQLMLSLAAPISNDMGYRHCVPEPNELNPIYIRSAQVTNIINVKASAPLLNELIFTLTNQHGTDNVTLLVSQNQRQWLNSRIQYWKRLGGR